MTEIRFFIVPVLLFCVGCNVVMNEGEEDSAFDQAKQIRKAILEYQFEGKALVQDRLLSELTETEIEANEDVIKFRGIVFDRSRNEH